MTTNYIRVAANVSDPYTKVTEVYSVAFKSNDNGLSGPYGNISTMDANDKAELKTKIDNNLNSPAIKQMFVPDTNRTQSDVNDPLTVISYHDKSFAANRIDTTSIEVTTEQQYYVYIYIENASEFNMIKPSDVYIGA